MSSATLRLLELLEAGKLIKAEANYIQGWATIFGTNDHDSVLRKIGLLYQLVQTAADEVMQIAPGQKRSVTHWKSQVTQALYSSHGSIEWRHFIHKLDEHTFEYLRLHSEITALTMQRSSIDFSQLEAARERLREAIAEISESALSKNIKIALIKRIRSVVNAIDDFMITGDERVFDEFKATLFDLSKTKEMIGEIPGKSKIREGLSIISDLRTCSRSSQQ